MKALRNKLAVISFLIIAIGLVFSGTLGFSTKVDAAPVVDFKPGRIIEDSVFTNTTSMTQSDIQSFLNSKVPSCDTWGTQPSEYGGGTRAQWAANASLHPSMGAFYPPFTCLKDYSENGKSAAQIIYEVAQQFTLNPQVLIVMLQKEQALVTDTWPSPIQYRSATGYGCPDTAPCDSQYYGLTNQLHWTGTMFRAILNDSSTWYTPYNLGNNYIRWSPDASCGGSNVFIENRSTQALYNYTPYQPNQAALNAGYGTAPPCGAYGNRNFYLYFRDWFGYNSGPAAYKTAGSSSIYVSIGGYRFTVPYMAALQDYGISSEAVQTVDQSYIDARPTAPLESGLSSEISHMVKSPRDDDEDGGSVYLISRGRRYQIQTLSQLSAFGFSEASIRYLPLSYIFSISNGGMLSSFITSPYGNVFKVDETSKTKQIFFEYDTYIANNPSDLITPLSYFLTDNIPSSYPITSRPVLLKGPAGDVVTLYQNNKYYGIPDYSVFGCWGLNTPTFGLPTYRIPQSNYVPDISPTTNLSCAITKDSTNYILSSNIKYTDLSLSISRLDISSDSALSNLLQRLPSRQEPLRAYVKAPDDAAVWYISGDSRRLLPSYNSFQLLGLTAGSIDILNNNILQLLTDRGIILADGQLVKAPDSAAVYVISSNTRTTYNSIEAFEAYKNSWSNIESYSATQLNGAYPVSANYVSSILVDKTANKSYVMNSGDTCYALSDDVLSRMGKTLDVLKSNQQYESGIFKNINLGTCMPSTNFIKDSGNSLVYWLSSGQKHPLTTYPAMLNRNDGIPPRVMVIDSAFIDTIATGTSFSQ